MASAHFICKDRLGIKGLGGGMYSSEAWDIQSSDADKLVGGRIFFHEKKTLPSYFGGIVLSYEEIETGNAHTKRILFKLETDKAGKGVPWAGRDDVMAWYSGVIND